MIGVSDLDLLLQTLKDLKICSGVNGKTYTLSNESDVAMDKTPIRVAFKNGFIIQSTTLRHLDCPMNIFLNYKTFDIRCENCSILMNKLKKAKHEANEDPPSNVAAAAKLPLVETSDSVNESIAKIITFIINSKIDQSSPRLRFLTEQFRLGLAKGPQALRYSPEMIRIAVKFWIFSKGKGYNELTGNWTKDKNGQWIFDGLLLLPSLHSLRDYSSSLYYQPGFYPEQVPDPIRHLGWTGKDLVGVIAFDGMKVRGELVSWRGGIVGFKNLFDYDENGDALTFDGNLLDPDDGPAEEFVQFYFISLNKGVAIPVAHHEKKLNANELDSAFWKIEHGLTEMGFIIVANAYDGAGENREFVRRNIKPDNSSPFDKGINYFKISSRPSNAIGFGPILHPIYCGGDPPHLAKRMRNQLMKSFPEASVENKIFINGTLLNWGRLIDALNYESQRKISFSGLTSECVHLTSRTKMRLIYVYRVLRNQRLLLDLEYLWKIALQEKKFEAAKEFKAMHSFLSFTKKCLDLLLSTDPLSNERALEIDSCLLTFKNWIDENRKSFPSNGPRHCFLGVEIIEDLARALTCLKSLRLYLIEKFSLNITPKTLTQDSVENHFSQVRSIYSNPNMVEVRRANAFIATQKTSRVDGSSYEVGALRLPFEFLPLARHWNKNSSLINGFAFDEATFDPDSDPLGELDSSEYPTSVDESGFAAEYIAGWTLKVGLSVVEKWAKKEMSSDQKIFSDNLNRLIKKKEIKEGKYGADHEFIVPIEGYIRLLVFVARFVHENHGEYLLDFEQLVTVIITNCGPYFFQFTDVEAPSDLICFLFTKYSRTLMRDHFKRLKIDKSESLRHRVAILTRKKPPTVFRQLPFEKWILKSLKLLLKSFDISITGNKPELIKLADELYEQRQLKLKEYPVQGADDNRHCWCGDSESGFMVLCNGCNIWYHSFCIDITEEDNVDLAFYCLKCSPPSADSVTTSKRRKRIEAPESKGSLKDMMIFIQSQSKGDQATIESKLYELLKKDYGYDAEPEEVKMDIDNND